LLAVLLFTVVVKLCLLPLDIKQRRAQFQQAGVSGRVKEIQARYKSDPRIAQQKVREFYKKENIKTSAGCLPMLLQLPVLFAMFGAISLLSNIQTVNLVTNMASGQHVAPPGALWVHNIWRPDAGNASVMPSLSEFRTLVTDMTGRMPNAVISQAQMLLNNSNVSQLALTAGSAQMQAGTYLGNLVQQVYITVPQSAVTAAVSMNYSTVIAPVLNQYAGFANGFYIFPVLAAVSTFFAQWLQKKQNEKVNNPAAAQQMAGMEYIMPIITLYWTATTGITFAVYWIATNLLSIVSMPLLTRVVGSGGKAIQTTK
jgi:YidC/Oxa1 family membrane protein insertase